MWTCIDIDFVGKYHPANSANGIDRIKQSMADIGLVEALEFQSSFCTGIHLFYPLPTVVKTWDLACALHHACRNHRLDVSAGNLELRPNTKNYKSGYLTIRLPFSGQGNGFYCQALVASSIPTCRSCATCLPLPLLVTLLLFRRIIYQQRLALLLLYVRK